MANSDVKTAVSDKNRSPRSILLIDDDDSLRNSVAGQLTKMGVERIDHAGDGDEAWELLQKSQYDVVISDWKMPKVSGLALANRMRLNESLTQTPILVLTGYLNRSDFRLLGEFPLVATLEKPYEISDLQRRLDQLMAEADFYQHESEDLKDLFTDFSENPELFASKLIEMINRSARPVPIAIKGARLLQDHNQLAAAESILKVVLTADPECTIALNELGKCYLKQRRYNDAKVALTFANDQCPNNLERLCLLGKANLSTADFAAAEDNFFAALKVDKENKHAQNGLTAAKGAAESLQIASSENISRSFVSLLNSRAIAKIHSKDFDDALKLYGSALDYSDDVATQIKLSFNMGLAYFRWNKQQEALKWFEKCAELSQRQFAKAMNNINLIRTKFSNLDDRARRESSDEESIGFSSSASASLPDHFSVSSVELGDDTESTIEEQVIL